MLGTEFIFRYMSTCTRYLPSMSGVVISKNGGNYGFEIDREAYRFAFFF